VGEHFEPFAQVNEPEPRSAYVEDPGAQLRSLLMLGRWSQQRAALDRAVTAVPEDPTDWTDTGITSALWSTRVGQQLKDEIPKMIAETGERPADVVVRLIRTALTFGIEVGRQLERAEQTPAFEVRRCRCAAVHVGPCARGDERMPGRGHA
jgi:hypothetical protein